MRTRDEFTPGDSRTRKMEVLLEALAARREDFAATDADTAEPRLRLTPVDDGEADPSPPTAGSTAPPPTAPPAELSAKPISRSTPPRPARNLQRVATRRLSSNGNTSSGAGTTHNARIQANVQRLAAQRIANQLDDADVIRRSTASRNEAATHDAALRLRANEAAGDDWSLPPEKRSPALGQAIAGPTDPRWVLALRTSEQLQGAVLSPERREKLVRMGKLMQLSPFDCNLIIAIVQDQARRGYAPSACPAAAEPQLTLVPLPGYESRDAVWRGRRGLYMAISIAAIIVVEILVLWRFL